MHIETGRSYQQPLLNPVFVDPGKSSFRIRREGFLSQEKVLDLEAGDRTTADITLNRAPGYGGAVTGAPTGTAAPTVAARSRSLDSCSAAWGSQGLIAGGALVGVASGMQDQVFKDAPLGSNGEPLCGPTAVTGEHPGCADVQ